MKYNLYGSNYNFVELIREYCVICRNMNDGYIVTLKRLVKDTMSGKNGVPNKRN